MLELARALPTVRDEIDRDLNGRGHTRRRALALALRVLDVGVFRTGGEEYAATNGSHGVVTLLREHVRVRREAVLFDYIAKGGIERSAVVRDITLARAMNALRRARLVDSERLMAYRNGGSWHLIHPEDVNQRFKELAGETFTVKDLRTWHATVFAAIRFASAAPPTGRTALVRAERSVMAAVAEELGNTPAVARRSYVDPTLIEYFRSGRTIALSVRRSSVRWPGCCAREHPHRSLLPTIGVAAGPGALQPCHNAAMTSQPVAGPRARELRTLGHSSVQVSRLSLGTAPLGGMYESVPDAVATELIGGALDAGLRYIDTAPHYGRGVAEERLAAVLPSRDRSTFVLSTKVGRLIVAAEGPADTSKFHDAKQTKAVLNFSAEGVRRSIGDSLERLGLDRIDIVYIHDPDDFADQAIGEAYPVLHELRSQGVIAAIGLGMNQSAIPARFVRETDIDAVLLAGRYTLIDQTGQADLLPLAAERGVSIVIGGVYNSGILADPNPDAKFDYAAAPEHLIERAIAIKEVCGRHDVTLPAVAIQFPLAHPAVATVLTGSRSLAELEVNLEAFEAKIPSDLWEDLAETGLLVESEAALRTT